MFGLDFVRKLKPCKWRYLPPLDDGVEHFGFIAQEVDELAPHEEYGFVCEQADGMYGIRLTEFIGPLVKAIQELDKRIDELERKSHGVSKTGELGKYQVRHRNPVGT